ncbi:MAG: hypothetical protein WAO55_12075 [Candidatus Manganitrophaceae bacterium]
MKFYISILFFVLISGCSSLDHKEEKGSQVLYKIVAVAETELDKNGDTCADATGVIRVLHNKVTGSASDTFGRGYRVSGSIDSNRNITGGFAITVVTAVDYNGQISEDGKRAKGEWKDLYECKGVWTATIIKS